MVISITTIFLGSIINMGEIKYKKDEHTMPAFFTIGYDLLSQDPSV